MSLKSQQNNMRTIHYLASQDLGYIYGERESGPNGIKKKFHSVSAAFLKALAKDLDFKESQVTKNYGGIAVSGEITLRGMWNNEKGLYLVIKQYSQPPHSFMYRRIKHMKDYTGEQNKWLNPSVFADSNYEQLVEILCALNPTKGIVCYVA